jgi:hypothetical protein
MAETTADVRRDIEMTRERMSTTLAQIEQKMNLMQIVRDHPWPAIAVAVGAGVLLSGSRADVKAAGAAVVATRGASSKIGTVLDDVVANLMTGVSQAFQGRVDSFVNEIKDALGAPTGSGSSHTGNRAYADGASRSGSDTTSGSGWSPSTGASSSSGLGGDGRSSGMSTGPLGTDRGPGSQSWQSGT